MLLKINDDNRSFIARYCDGHLGPKCLWQHGNSVTPVRTEPWTANAIATTADSKIVGGQYRIDF